MALRLSSKGISKSQIMKTTLPTSLKLHLLIVLTIVSVSVNAQVIPELVFRNPVLASGTDKQVGAKYRFANAANNIDAMVEIKKKSGNNVVINNIDLTTFGWDKAFQPELGLPGGAGPWQNWWVEFEVTFLNAGTNTKTKVDRFDVTALDVDGDNYSIQEYVQLQKPDSITYSTISQLINGTPDTDEECEICGESSAVIVCPACLGNGNSGPGNCNTCNGKGKIYELCGHPWDGKPNKNQTVVGPVLNFLNIDTLGTLVMSTSHYSKVDKFKIKIGAQSGANASSASMRLNSLWFRSFNLSSLATMPVKLNYFRGDFMKPSVELTWKTTEEQGFNHFVIERSKDGKNFSDAAIVFPKDNGSLQNIYSFKDPQDVSAKGVIYYRLKTVSNDSKIDISSVVAVKVGEAVKAVVQAYPNPVRNELSVTIPKNWQNKNTIIQLYNNMGKMIRQRVAVTSNATEVIGMNDVSPGSYFIKLISGNESAIQQVVKN
jgi:hypothetical protein